MISFAYSLKVDFNSGFTSNGKRFWPTLEESVNYIIKDKYFIRESKRIIQQGGVLIIGEGYVQWISNEWYD